MVALFTTLLGLSTVSLTFGTNTEPTADTSFGRLVGKVDENGCHAFLGVPFAQAPLGNLRFATPRDWTATWTGNRNATRFASPCVQALGSINSGHEDCLYLNVWSSPPPTTKGDTDLKAVMIFLHGGEFQEGSGNEPAPPLPGNDYDGCLLARNGDVVVVTLNYRLGPFGFFAYKDEGGATVTNHGLRDQRSALRYVRDQIQHFGGDPHKVTLFGESAGAFSVMHHVISRKSAGLFRRGIMESNPWVEVGSNAFGITMSQEITHEAGCASGAPVTAMLACMRALSTNQIAAAATKANFAATGALWGVVIDDDELSGFPSDLLHAGNFTRNVSVIAGFNTNEANIFIYPKYPVGMDRQWYYKSMTAFLRNNASGVSQMRPFDPAEVAKVFEHYPPKKIGDNRPVASMLSTDACFLSGSRWMLNELLRHSTPRDDASYKVYSYRFNYAPKSCELAPGAYHSREVPYVFGRPFGACPFTAAAKTLSGRIQEYWTNFAKTGDPNNSDDKDPSRSVTQPALPHWSSYDSESTRSLVLDVDVEMEEGYRKDEVAFWHSTPWFKK